MIVALPYTNISWSIEIYTLNNFGELAVTCTPLRMVNIDPHSLYFSCIYPLIWQTTVAKQIYAHVFLFTGSVGTGM